MAQNAFTMLWRRRRLRNLAFLLFLLASLLYLLSGREREEAKGREREGAQNGRERRGKRWAYVFYVTQSDYICYAMVNAARLINNLSMTLDAEPVLTSSGYESVVEVLIVSMDTAHVDMFCPGESCKDGRIKVKRVPKASPDLTDNIYYAQSYLRFESFRLYQYERIIIVDADGLILRNMDHLFEIDLEFEGHMLGGLNADYQSSKWLSSILLVVEPSPKLYNSIAPYLEVENIGKVADFANGSRFDMDILNYVFDRGSKAFILPPSLANLDSYFYDSDRDDEFDRALYVHFSAKKPFTHQETETWVLGGNFPSTAKGMRLMYTWFWDEFYRECQPLVKRFEPVSVFAKDKGFYYPDPNDMADYINNISHRYF